MTSKKLSDKSPIYTIGHRGAYTKGLAEHGKLFEKLGYREPGEKGNPNSRFVSYPGGIIFVNPADARKYIAEELEPSRRPLYAIWEIDGDWEQDCKPNKAGRYWRDLQVDRPIVCMVVE